MVAHGIYETVAPARERDEGEQDRPDLEPLDPGLRGAVQRLVHRAPLPQLLTFVVVPLQVCQVTLDFPQVLEMREARLDFGLALAMSRCAGDFRIYARIDRLLTGACSLGPGPGVDTRNRGRCRCRSCMRWGPLHSKHRTPPFFGLHHDTHTASLILVARE